MIRYFPNCFEDNDESDEIDFDKVVAISANYYIYEYYEDIPTISSPKFLMVKDKKIIIDGWLIRLLPRRDFLDFVLKMATSWNWTEGDAKNQLIGFIEDLEVEVGSPYP